MKFIQSISQKLFSFKEWFRKKSLPIKMVLVLLILAFSWLIISKLFSSKAQTHFQIAQVEKGTLIVSLSLSGQISAANSAVVTTQASGVVNRVYVENGQKVQVGAPIAEIDLDLEGKQRSTQALASYQNAKNSLESAKANLYSMQSTLFTNWKTYMDIAQSSLYQNSDGSPKTSERQLPQFMSTNDDWFAAEAKYKNQQNSVIQAQTALNSSWYSYQQASPVIYAPISGTVTGLSLQIGSVLTAQSNSFGTSASQKIASIKTSVSPMVSINLTEMDAPKVKIGNKATLTLDAFPGKTYTGKVISIDTVGTINSGVTIYPTVIKLDTEVTDILPNMSVQANLVTEVKENVILIPISAVQTQNSGVSFVRVMRNGQMIEVPVETGLSSSSQTEIISGLSEGEIVVTSAMQLGVSGQQRNAQTQSPFGLFGAGFRGGAGGGGFSRGR